MTTINISCPLGILTAAGMDGVLVSIIRDLRVLGYCPAVCVGVGVIVPDIRKEHLRSIGERYGLQTSMHRHGIEVVLEALSYPPGGQLNRGWQALRY